VLDLRRQVEGNCFGQPTRGDDDQRPGRPAASDLAEETPLPLLDVGVPRLKPVTAGMDAVPMANTATAWAPPTA
jgi:hypothetical protein